MRPMIGRWVLGRQTESMGRGRPAIPIREKRGEGKQLAVLASPATIPPPSLSGPLWHKALGAGGELGICITKEPLTKEDMEGAGLEEIRIASRGLTGADWTGGNGSDDAIR